jgi:ribosomal protein L7Ae-like RNA K-turn-binding protein
MNNKLLSFLGIAKKAGKLSFGHDAVKKLVIEGNCKLIILAKDYSEKSAKDIYKIKLNYKVNLYVINHNMSEIEKALGKFSGVIAISDCGFSKRIIELIDIDK